MIPERIICFCFVFVLFCFCFVFTFFFFLFFLFFHILKKICIKVYTENYNMKCLNYFAQSCNGPVGVGDRIC